MSDEQEEDQTGWEQIEFCGAERVGIVLIFEK